MSFELILDKIEVLNATQYQRKVYEGILDKEFKERAMRFFHHITLYESQTKSFFQLLERSRGRHLWHLGSLHSALRKLEDLGASATWRILERELGVQRLLIQAEYTYLHNTFTQELRRVNYPFKIPSRKAPEIQ